MVNLHPPEPRPTDPDFRAWLLARLDFIRAMVEAGEDCMISDMGGFTAHDGRRVRVASFHFYAEAWVQHHRAHRTER